MEDIVKEGFDMQEIEKIADSARDDNYCYKEAKRLGEKYGKDIFEVLFDS